MLDPPSPRVPASPALSTASASNPKKRKFNFHIECALKEAEREHELARARDAVLASTQGALALTLQTFTKEAAVADNTLHELNLQKSNEEKRIVNMEKLLGVFDSSAAEAGDRHAREDLVACSQHPPREEGASQRQEPEEANCAACCFARWRKLAGNTVKQRKDAMAELDAQHELILEDLAHSREQVNSCEGQIQELKDQMATVDEEIRSAKERIKVLSTLSQ